MTLQYARLVQTAKPFVKWAGGKRQLVRALSENMPEKYGTYYEPFLGGGAFLFHILEQNPFHILTPKISFSHISQYSRPEC